jgi:hypothetical protein
VFVNWWYTAENLYEAGGITNDHALRTGNKYPLLQSTRSTAI